MGGAGRNGFVSPAYTHVHTHTNTHTHTHGERERERDAQEEGEQEENERALGKSLPVRAYMDGWCAVCPIVKGLLSRCPGARRTRVKIFPVTYQMGRSIYSGFKLDGIAPPRPPPPLPHSGRGRASDHAIWPSASASCTRHAWLARTTGSLVSPPFPLCHVLYFVQWYGYPCICMYPAGLPFPRSVFSLYIYVCIYHPHVPPAWDIPGPPHPTPTWPSKAA